MVTIVHAKKRWPWKELPGVGIIVTPLPAHGLCCCGKFDRRGLWKLQRCPPSRTRLLPWDAVRRIKARRRHDFFDCLPRALLEMMRKYSAQQENNLFTHVERRLYPRTKSMLRFYALTSTYAWRWHVTYRTSPAGRGCILSMGNNRSRAPSCSPSSLSPMANERDSRSPFRCDTLE